ncbi:MAG: TetR/AcrR family transcriptional regulator [Proteobacteria bacterium]|nr:TetR/AcrR family transcriptional regulator [Pseudomonadota bacterium]
MPKPRIEKLDTSRIALIMSVALDEFARHRYQEASFNRIIKASQMAKGTMYYYFASKEDLFMTLYKATVREFNRLLPLLRQTPADGLQFWLQTQDILDGLQSLLTSKPGISQFVINFLTGGEQQDEHPARDTAIKVNLWLQNWLQHGQDLQAIRHDLPAERLAALSWGIWQAVYPSRTPLRDGLDHTALILDLMRRLLNPTPTQTAADWPELTETSASSDLTDLNY